MLHPAQSTADFAAHFESSWQFSNSLGRQHLFAGQFGRQSAALDGEMCSEEEEEDFERILERYSRFRDSPVRLGRHQDKGR